MQTVADILRAAVARTPTATAIVSGEDAISYEQLLDRAVAVGSKLTTHGLKLGDCILTILQNHHDAVILHWAAQLYGFVICPINWRSTPQEIDYFLKDCSACAIFFDESAAKSLAESVNAKPLLCCDVSRPAKGPNPWQGFLSSSPSSPPSITSDITSVLLYTSGTTGPGKGVPRSHMAERAAALAHIGQSTLLFGDIALGVMPLYHTMGVRLMLCSTLLSGTFVCQNRFEASHALDLIQKHQISSLFLVPTLYHDLVEAQDQFLTDLSTVSKLGFAGASMTDGLLQKLQRAFNVQNIVNHYGSTEIYSYTVNQNASLKPGSAGRAGLNSEIRIIPLGSLCVKDVNPVGTEGQIIARANSNEAFQGYLNRPDADAKALIDGWYFTGDVGFFDKCGELFLTGRVDDMIITGGENVMPIEIESILSLHDDVKEVVIVGKPDARLGEAITAFIVPRKNVTTETLDAHCRASGLAGFKCPKHWVFVEEIPKSPVGKILRRLL